MDNGAISYRRYLDGDNEGLRALVEAYSDRLVFFLCGIVGSRETAEDIAADVFALLVVKKPRFRAESAFITWLFQIGRNLAYNELRRQKRRQTSPLDAASEQTGDDVEKEILKTERQQRLYAALRHLHPDYRQVLILLYFENLDYETTARVMKKNQKQIKNLAYRARQALKTRLEQEGFSDEPF